MPYIKANGLKFHVQEMNKSGKKTVCMIHGMFSNLSIYYFNIAPFLAEDYHIVLYDLKAHGFSEKTTGNFDMHSMAEDFLAIMDTLQVKDFHLVGYSFGGLISLKVARLAPERLDKLVVIECPKPDDMETLGLISNYSKEMLAYFVNSATVEIRMGKRQMERQHKRYEFLCNETTLHDDMLEESDFFQNGGLNEIKNAVCLIYGNASKCIASGSELHNIISDSQIIFLDGDHNIPLQQPEKTAIAIHDFFKEN